MMLSGQVHLCHLLASNQVYAFNQTNDDLSGDGGGISADMLHRCKGRSLFRRTLLLDRFQADEIIIEA